MLDKEKTTEDTQTAQLEITGREDVFRVGATLQDRYLIERELGMGGNGVVYKAWDMRLRDDVAIKLFFRQGLAELRSVVSTLRRLSEPRLVKIFHLDLYRGSRPYIVMEYIEGKDLRQLRKKRPFTQDEVKNIIRDLIQALKVLHENEIYHLDLKPTNIIITKQGQLKLLDFGISQKRRIIKQKEGIKGTPNFMAPEQMKGESLDHRTDIYLLGLLTYWLLTGKNYTHPRQLEALPRKWRKFLRKALAPEKEDRFSSLDEMERALFPPERKGLKWAVAAMAVVIAALLTVMFFPSSKKSVFRLQIQGQLLIAYDDEGRRLWRKRIPFVESEARKFYRIKDLDGDRKEEIILFANLVKEEGPVTTLMVMNNEGRWLWRYQFDEPIKTAERIFYPPYNPRELRVDDLDSDGKREIVLVAQHSFYPCFITAFTSGGDRIGTLWHAGRIGGEGDSFLLADLNGDGIKEIVAGGANAEYKKAVFMVISPLKLEGKSPQTEGSKYDFPSKKVADFETYILFPASSVGKFFGGVPVVSFVFPRRRTIEIGVKELHVFAFSQTPSVIYILNRKFRLLDVELSSPLRTLMKLMNLKTEPQQERLRLMNSVLVWNRRGWVPLASKKIFDK